MPRSISVYRGEPPDELPDELLEALELPLDDALVEDDDDAAGGLLELLPALEDGEPEEELEGEAELDAASETPIAESLEAPQATATRATAHMLAASVMSERMTASSPEAAHALQTALVVPRGWPLTSRHRGSVRRVRLPRSIRRAWRLGRPLPLDRLPPPGPSRMGKSAAAPSAASWRTARAGGRRMRSAAFLAEPPNGPLQGESSRAVASDRREVAECDSEHLATFSRRPGGVGVRFSRRPAGSRLRPHAGSPKLRWLSGTP
jgi:hypothetical protein